MKEKTARKLLLSLYHYICFFLLMAFLITCCMMLFLSILSSSTGLTFTEENTKTAAWLTFGNVVFLSLLCTVIDAVRRAYTVDKPVKKILEAAEQIAQGNYTVRIPPLRSLNRADGLDQIVTCFNRMAEELSGVETLQTDFIANVSHELKTPLAIMQNYATLLTEHGLAEAEREKYANATSEACRRLADLVSNILKLNKLENQQIHPSATSYNLSEQLCACLLEFEALWEEKEISIETAIAEDVFVYTDAELLSLVWNNLLSNAFKFTERGGRVSLFLQVEEDCATVSVQDTGCGMTPEVGRHIFEKFYQGDTSRATNGNGLGLALVRRVMDIIGGEITVNSVTGQGSIFTVKIKRMGDGYVESDR